MEINVSDLLLLLLKVDNKILQKNFPLYPKILFLNFK